MKPLRIFAGLQTGRKGMTIFVLLAIMAEFLMGPRGMGGMFRNALDDFAMYRVIGTSLIATATSTAAFVLLTCVERRVRKRWF